MPVNILPTDTITPALNNVFGQLNNINLAKMQEETRKRNELADLTAISLQNISANDNIYLQKQKDQFLKDAAKSYGENKGYLPYETQAELNARKSNILMEAKASEEWKKQYEDVVKQMATSDKIDKDKTAANLKQMMFTNGEPIPPSQRPNPYNAVSLNFDTAEYNRQNINKSLQKTMEFDPKDKRKILTVEELSPENVFNQIKGFMNNPSYKMKTEEQAKEAGYSDVDQYIKDKVVPDYVHKDTGFAYHYPSQTNVYVGNQGAPSTSPPGQGHQVKVKATQTITLADGTVTQTHTHEVHTYTPSNTTPMPPSVVNFDGKDILFSDNVARENAGPVPIKIQATDYYPSVYNARLKRWFIVTDENRSQFKQEDIQNKPWFTGTSTTGVGNKKKEVLTFVPVTGARKQAIEKELGPNSGKPGYKIGDTPGQFDESTSGSGTKSGSLSEAQKKYPNYTPDQLKAAYLKQFGITLK